MNSEETEINDEPAEAQPSGINLKDIYYVLFRHKWLVLVGFIVGIVSAGTVYFLKPPKYQSVALLFVRYVLEKQNRSLDPTDTDSHIQSPDSAGSGILGAEKLILSSFDSASHVADAIGPEKILAKVGHGTDRFQAAGFICGNLTTEVLGNNMIRVAIEHPDPELVQPVLRQLITNYLEKSYVIRRPPGVFDEVLARRAEELRLSLKETEDKLGKLKKDAGVSSLEETKKSQAEQISRIRADLISADAELAAQKVGLEDTAQTAPPDSTSSSNSVVAELKVPPEKVDQYRNTSALLDSLHKQENEYLLHYADTSFFVVSVRKRIADVDKQKRTLEAEYPSLTKLDALNASGGGQRGQNAQFGGPSGDAYLKVPQLEAKIKVLNEKLQEIRDEAAKVDAAEPEITRLQREKALLDASYQYCKSNLEQSKAEQTMGAGKFSNISVIQEPSPPGKNFQKPLKRMGIAFAFWMFGSIGLAFLIEMVLDQSVRRPEDITTKLHLPLFLTIPHLPRNGRARLAAHVKGAGLAVDPAQSQNEANSLSGARQAHDTEEHGAGESATGEVRHGLRAYYEALRNRLITHFDIKNMTHKPKMIAITSCSKGAGVTSTASGLAATLSEIGDGNVLLVDMNRGQGTAHPFYKGKPACRLADVLESEKRTSALVGGNLYLASVSEPKEKLPRVLPKRFTELVPKLKMSDFDYVVFDMPVISQTSTTPMLAAYMDLVLLLIDSEKTSRHVVAQASSLLAESKVNVKAVLNKYRRYVPDSLQQEL